jgi:hypothetical protein
MSSRSKGIERVYLSWPNKNVIGRIRRACCGFGWDPRLTAQPRAARRKISVLQVELAMIVGRTVCFELP